VPWADTADVIFTAAGRFERDQVELVAHPSVDGAARLFEVRGTPVPVPVSTTATTRPHAASRPSSAAWPIACCELTPTTCASASSSGVRSARSRR
jgi:hypothetical protein